MKRKILETSPRGNRYYFDRLGLATWQSEKNGGPVLLTGKHWTKISGIRLNTPWGCYWLRFRRFG